MKAGVSILLALALCASAAPLSAQTTAHKAAPATVPRSKIPYIDVHTHIDTSEAPDVVMRRLKQYGVVAAIVMDSDPDIVAAIKKQFPRFVAPAVGPVAIAKRKGFHLGDDTGPALAKLYDRKAICVFGEVPALLVGPSGAPETGGPEEPTRAAAVENRFRTAIYDAAEARGAMVNLHVDILDDSVEAAVGRVAASHPHIQLVVAHAGVRAGAEVMARLMAAHPNIYSDLSTRMDEPVTAQGNVPGPTWHWADGGWRADEERVTPNSVIEADGHLKPEWKAVIGRFPDRFMFAQDLGRDRARHIEQYVALARTAFGDLPRKDEELIAHGNIERLLKGKSCGLSRP